MNLFQNEYAELIALTRSYLLQEYDSHERLYADQETYAYFRALVAKKAASANPSSQAPLTPSKAITPQQSIPLSPLLASKTPAIPERKAPMVDHKPEKSTMILEEKKENERSLEVQPEIIESSPKQTVNSEKEVRTKAAFIPEPISPASAVDTQEIRKILSEKCPSIRYLDTIPSDQEAKNKACLWKNASSMQVLMIAFGNHPKQNMFLENLRFAAETQGWRAHIARGQDIEKDPLFDPKKLQAIIAIRSEISSSSILKKLCGNEISDFEHNTLNNIPLLLLDHPANYILDPSLKQSLWKSLKKFLPKQS